MTGDPTTVTTSAPGKLFVTGEWAVLRGAPALVAAVDRRATVGVRPGDDGLVVESLAEGRTARLALDAPLPLGDAGTVLAAARALGVRAPLRVTVDSRPFLIGERKLGLGRSAATLVAATAALRPDASTDALLDAALAANALFQAGQGSGADIAAAVHGGVVEARRDDIRLRVARRALPAGLHLLAGWTGTSAHTTPLLERFATSMPPASFAELVATAERAADAAARGDATALLDAVDRSATLLARVGADLDLPIVTPALDALVRAANRVGAVAKPSGAGAGDCGIALATSPAQAAAVRAAWQEAGILPLEIVIATEGATVG